MKKLRKLVLGFVLMLSLLGLPGSDLQAQCPMCKMAAESNLKDGGTAGRGLNKGILYMFLTPYLVIGTIGFVWWRNRPKEEDGIMKDEL